MKRAEKVSSPMAMASECDKSGSCYAKLYFVFLFLKKKKLLLHTQKQTSSLTNAVFARNVGERGGAPGTKKNLQYAKNK
jgi:hypothetical protein